MTFHLLQVLALLLGIARPQEQLVTTTTGQVAFTPAAKKAFLYMYHMGTTQRGSIDAPVVMTRTEFYLHCHKCSTAANQPSSTPPKLDVKAIDKVLHRYSSSGATTTPSSSTSSSTSSSGDSSDSSDDEKDGHVTSIDRAGYLRWYLDSMGDGEEKIKHAWSDLRNYGVQPNLSFPHHHTDNNNGHNTTTTNNTTTTSNTTNTTNDGTAATTLPLSVLPVFCQQTILSDQFCLKFIGDATTDLSSSFLVQCCEASPSLVVHLVVPALVAAIKEQELYGDTQLATSASRTTAFVAKTMQMLTPLFHSNNNNSNSNGNSNGGLPLLAPESFDDTADDGLRATAVEIDRAESFLFGYESASATLTTLFSQNPMNPMTKSDHQHMNADLFRFGLLGTAQMLSETT